MFSDRWREESFAAFFIESPTAVGSPTLNDRKWPSRSVFLSASRFEPWVAVSKSCPNPLRCSDTYAALRRRHKRMEEFRVIANTRQRTTEKKLGFGRCARGDRVLNKLTFRYICKLPHQEMCTSLFVQGDFCYAWTTQISPFLWDGSFPTPTAKCGCAARFGQGWKEVIRQIYING